MLDPDAVAARTFGTSFRGYDTEEVRRFLLEIAGQLRSLAAGVLEGLDDAQASALLGEETGRLLVAARASAAAIESQAQERAAEVLREAQDEAVRLRATVEAERERAYAEGAAHAEEVLADAERARDAILADARSEAARLVAEAEGARERVLRDLARRRKALRAQVEQLHAARDELLRAMADVGRIADEARGRLVVALPEAKVAASAAARRVEAEPEVTVEQLESEIEAFRLAGLSLAEAADEATDAAADAAAEDALTGEPAAEEPVAEAAPAAEAQPEPVREAEPEPMGEAEPEPAGRDRVSNSVRILRPEPEVQAELEPEPEPEREPEAVAEAEAEAEVELEVEEAPDAARPTPATVDELFARLKADRDARTAAAEAILADPEPAREPEPEAVAEPEPDLEPDLAPEPARADVDRDALLARRDELLATPTAELTRRLKRLLADEQNAILDALRREGAVAAAAVDADDLATRWAAEAAPDLQAAASAGAAFVERPGTGVPDLADVAADLAASTAVPFAHRIADAVRDADGDADLAAEGVRNTCREWRTRRLADAVDLAVHAAFGRGALAAVTSGDDHVSLCWVVDDGGAPCPDAEDNALAGPVPAGEPFPTGDRHPPAHPGCRCVLAVVAAATAAAR